MKRIIITTILLSCFEIVTGQQVIESSQYMNNDYAFNSAVAGSKSNLRVSLGARKQWVGFESSPAVQNLTFQGRVAKSIGLGAQVYNDSWGLSRRTGVNLGVNYILPVSNSIDLSFGLSATLNQFSINREKIVTEVPDDAAVYDGLQNQLFPDAGFSVYLSASNFYAGASMLNLIEIKNDLVNSIASNNYLNRKIYAIAGANFDAGNTVVLEPSIIFGYNFNGTPELQADLKANFKSTFWIGAGYRNGDAVIAQAGVYLQNFTIGYSFDYTISTLKNALGGGSHELFVAFDIVKNDKKSSWFKRNRIYNQNRR